MLYATTATTLAPKVSKTDMKFRDVAGSAPTIGGGTTFMYRPKRSLATWKSSLVSSSAARNTYGQQAQSHWLSITPMVSEPDLRFSVAVVASWLIEPDRALCRSWSPRWDDQP